jgi:transposase
VRSTEPVDHDLPGHGWTVPKLIELVERMLGHRPSRTKLRTLLKAHKLSWKKCRKVLRKANPEKRAAFIEQFRPIFEQVCQNETILLYIDEAHIHRDMDLGYTWAPRGEPAYRLSACASLSDRINWYGAYNFTDGQCLIWNEGNCNTDHTLAFLERIAEWLGKPERPVLIIWDGAPWHRAIRLRERAEELGFELMPLPGYSPDLNPIEGLWKWMREEVTQHHSYPTMPDLFQACKNFIDRVNLDPDALVKRLWPKLELDPEFEKLLIS